MLADDIGNNSDRQLPLSPEFRPEALPNLTLAWQAMGLIIAGLVISLLVGLIFNKIYLIDSSIRLGPVALIGFLYIYRSNADLSVIRPPSPGALGWSVAGFFFALVAGPTWSSIGLTVGVITGLFLRLSPHEMLRDLKSQDKIGKIIIAGLLIGPIMLFVRKLIWMVMSYVTAWSMSFLLIPFYTTVNVLSKSELLSNSGTSEGILTGLRNLGMKFSARQPNFVMLTTDSNTFMKFVSTMSIVNGLSLMVAMLAAYALFQGPQLRKYSLVKIYGFSFAFIWASNILWLTMMYLMLPSVSVGKPDATSAIARQLMTAGGTPFSGWIGYLLLTAVPLIVLWYYDRKQPENLHA